MTRDERKFDPKAVKWVASYPTPGALYTIAVDEGRKIAYGAGTQGAVFTLNLAASPPVAERRWDIHENYVSSLLVRQNALISAGFDRTIVWTDWKTGKRIRTVDAHHGWVRKIAMTPDGTQLISVGDDMVVRIWDANTGEKVTSLMGHEVRTPEGYWSALYSLAISPDGRHIASGDRIGSVCIWDRNSHQRVATFRAQDFYTFDAQKRARAIGGIRGLAFSSDGKHLALSGIGPVTNVDGFVGPCRIEWWDWASGKRVIMAQDKHQAILNHIAPIPGVRWWAAAGGGDGGGAIVFWDTAGATLHVARPKGHLHDFAIPSDGTRLIAAGHGGFQVWQLA